MKKASSVFFASAANLLFFLLSILILDTNIAEAGHLGRMTMPSGISDIQVNGQILNSTTCYQYDTTNIFHNCDPMLFTATYSGSAPTHFNLRLTGLNSTCQEMPAILNYSSGWQAGSISSNLDLRNLTDSNGRSITSFGGFVKLTYQIIEGGTGDTVSITRILRVYAPLPSVMNLEINQVNSSGNQNLNYAAASQDINNPVLFPVWGPAFKVTNTTGNIKSVSIGVEEVDSNGNPILFITSDTFYINGTPDITYFPLANFCVDTAVWGFNPSLLSPGYPPCNDSSGFAGYFAYNNGQLVQGKILKLTVTLSNNCNSISNYSFMQQSGGPTGSPDQENENLSISVYPNPVQDKITIKIQGPELGEHSIDLFDQLGRAIAVNFQQNTELGTIKFSCDISSLTPGMYFYRINSGSVIHSGKFIKSN